MFSRVRARVSVKIQGWNYPLRGELSPQPSRLHTRSTRKSEGPLTILKTERAGERWCENAYSVEKIERMSIPEMSETPAPPASTTCRRGALPAPQPALRRSPRVYNPSAVFKSRCFTRLLLGCKPVEAVTYCPSIYEGEQTTACSRKMLKCGELRTAFTELLMKRPISLYQLTQRPIHTKPHQSLREIPPTYEEKG